VLSTWRIEIVLRIGKNNAAIIAPRKMMRRTVFSDENDKREPIKRMLNPYIPPSAIFESVKIKSEVPTNTKNFKSTNAAKKLYNMGMLTVWRDENHANPIMIIKFDR
jgi:hypothetical protein